MKYHSSINDESKVGLFTHIDNIDNMYSCAWDHSYEPSCLTRRQHSRRHRVQGGNSRRACSGIQERNIIRCRRYLEIKLPGSVLWSVCDDAGARHTVAKTMN